MAFPVVEETSTYGSGGNTSSPSIPMPTGPFDSGDLLVMVVNADDANTTQTTPTGWTLLGNSTAGTGSLAARGYVYAKLSDGTEGGTNVSVTLSASRGVAGLVWRISGVYGTDVASTVAIAAATIPLNANPASATAPQGAGDNLFLAIAFNGDDAIEYTAAPTGYSGLITDSGGASAGDAVGVGGAQKTSTSASDDPDAFTPASAPSYDYSTTLAISPAAAGGGAASISSVPASTTRGGTGYTIGGSGFEASQGTGTVTYGGESCTVTAWSDTSITVTIPSAIALQHDTTGYTFVVTPDTNTADTSSAVPFNPPAGYDYIDLVSPVTTSGSMLEGYTGDAPVTGDQLVFEALTDGGYDVVATASDGSFELDDITTPALVIPPTTDQVFSRYVIQANGTIGTESDLTVQFENPPAAPTVTSASLNEDRDSLTIVCSATVNIGAGGNGGLTLSTGQTLTYSSGAGTAILTYSVSPAVGGEETPTLSYTQPGNGIENASGTDLATFSGRNITLASGTEEFLHRRRRYNQRRRKRLH